jgi:hypothetical protein
MTLLIEDTARNNLASWTLTAVQTSAASGAIISPFTTPRSSTSYKQSGRQTVTRLIDAQANAWFDPTTHALQMPNIGDFRYYDDWELWDTAGTRGALGTHGEQQDHVQRVFAVQDALGVPHLAPTILLHSPQSTTSQHALDLAQVAVDEDDECFLSVAGDAAFWAAGPPLDAHIGALAQLEPAGWFLTVVRNVPVLPVPAMAEEVHGLCRSVRSLSEDGPVHVSHGDLAALPAVAAGASTIGTGWDPRQRVCAYASYAQRDTTGEGGQWFVQSTVQGLLSLLGRADAQLLAAQNQALSQRLMPGQVPPGPGEAFQHHAEVLSGLVRQLQPGGQGAYRTLAALYQSARTDWPTVASAIGGSSQADAWTSQLLTGLRQFAATEGW